MESKEQLRKIAIFCDSYSPLGKDELKAQKREDSFKSCENCKYFTEKRECKLDLIDKVLSSLAMENELKS